MISRLLLVSLVGFLGISLPDGAEPGRGGCTPARAGETPCAVRRGDVTFEPIAVEDGSIDRVASELNRQSEGLDLPRTLMAQVATLVRVADEAEPGDAVEDLFAGNQVWSEPLPAFEPIAAVEGLSGVADELNRASEGIDLDPADVSANVPRRPTFEPIAVAVDASSVADELNRASEGASATADAGSKIGTALRMTHEAALAWMNVLTRTMSSETISR